MKVGNAVRRVCYRRQRQYGVVEARGKVYVPDSVCALLSHSELSGPRLFWRTSGAIVSAAECSVDVPETKVSG